MKRKETKNSPCYRAATTGGSSTAPTAPMMTGRVPYGPNDNGPLPHRPMPLPHRPMMTARSSTATTTTTGWSRTAPMTKGRSRTAPAMTQAKQRAKEKRRAADGKRTARRKEALGGGRRGGERWQLL